MAEGIAFLLGAYIWEPYADKDLFCLFNAGFTGHSKLNGLASRVGPWSPEKPLPGWITSPSLRDPGMRPEEPRLLELEG